MAIISKGTLTLNDEDIFVRKVSYTPATTEKKSVVEYKGTEIRVQASEDITTALGMLKGTVTVTGDNIRRFKRLAASGAPLFTAKYSSDDDNFNVVLTSAIIVNRPEINLEHEGEFEIEVEGQEVSI